MTRAGPSWAAPRFRASAPAGFLRGLGSSTRNPAVRTGQRRRSASRSATSELSVATAHDAFTADGRLREPQLAVSLCSIVSELLQRTMQDAA